MLIRAFAQVATEHPDTLLVLPGGEGPAEHDVRRAIEREGVAGQVRRLGRIPNGALEVLYRRTTALTFPSRYEGFGMSVLEVMNEGRPVIASTAGALPEIVGEGGLLLDPDDTTAWSTALDQLLRDRARWRQLADAATARAATFTWRQSVEDVVALYRRAAQGPLRGARAAMNILVLCPHFAPDVAPTGEVMTRIVTELAARGHGLHVVTALPWYQHHELEPGWDGQLVRSRTHPVGPHHPGASVPDRQAEHPRARLGLRRIHGVVDVGGWPRREPSPMSCSPCRRRSRSARPDGPSPEPAASRSSSTSRTCSLTWRSSSATSRASA